MIADRVGVPELRDGHHLDPRLGRELLERGAEHRLAVAEVRPQADVGTRHAEAPGRSAVAPDHSTSIPAGRGLRTRTRARDTGNRPTSASATARRGLDQVEATRESDTSAHAVRDESR